MNKRILATLGPESFSADTIGEMAELGVSLFRLNLSHTRKEEVEDRIAFVRSCTDVPLSIDTEGAQIRNQNMKGGFVHFEKDSVVKIHFEEVLGDEENISFTPRGIVRNFVVGDRLNIDFDLTSIEVIETTGSYAYAKVLQSGKVGSNKAVTLNRPIDMPAITEKDIHSIELGRKMGIVNFALSFAGSSEDVNKVRSLAGPDAHVISKIESRKGLHNLKAISEASDAILIDRGDLSREIPLVTIPFMQRRIIAQAKLWGCPVYVATNLLESMLVNRTPTRAEINDVVSTLLMGADGLVLAAETAVGKHPALAVTIARDMIRMCERWTPNTNIEELLELSDDQLN